MDNMIIVSDITSSYGRKQVLKGVSFTAKRGECIGIAGANGCGKTTLLSVLAGVRRPKSGTVQYGGRMCRDRRVIREMTGYVPQEDPLIPELSVYDNLRLWYPDRKTLRQELEHGFLNMLGIDGFIGKRVDKLSGGMKKRVSIGIAMAGTPPVLLMDEPGAALDLICKEDIRKYLQAYLAHQGTVVIATHEESELALCDRLYVMKSGVLFPADKTLRGEALTALF